MGERRGVSPPVYPHAAKNKRGTHEACSVEGLFVRAGGLAIECTPFARQGLRCAPPLATRRSPVGLQKTSRPPSSARMGVGYAPGGEALRATPGVRRSETQTGAARMLMVHRPAHGVTCPNRFYQRVSKSLPTRGSGWSCSAARPEPTSRRLWCGCHRWLWVRHPR